jgi:hypothetical protein
LVVLQRWEYNQQDQNPTTAKNKTGLKYIASYPRKGPEGRGDKKD